MGLDHLCHPSAQLASATHLITYGTQQKAIKLCPTF